MLSGVNGTGLRGSHALRFSNMSLKTKNIVDSFENPEDINSAPETAPSKRLLAINQKYDKVLEGNVIALEVGINEMLAKCPRFADWVSRLIEACSE